MAEIIPLHDRLVVKQLDAENTTAGGIVIPETNKEKPTRGKVVKIGPGKYNTDGKLQPLQVKEGDQIIFGKYAGTAFKLDNEEFLILREEDVLGVIA